MVRVAVAQIDPELGNTQYNLNLIEQAVAQAAEQKARFVVLPEAAVTGYVFRSLDEAAEVADPVPGPITRGIAAMTERHQIYAVVGMLERSGREVYNTAVLSGPRGVEAIYRKTHVLCLGVDRFTTPGDIPYRVHELPFGRIGILICYDLRFPESVRVLALEGAQLIALPTNWPQSSFIQADVFTRSRAAENRVFVLAADRVGEERGTRFLGRSQIVAVDGEVLAEASRDRAEMLVQDIDLSRANTKNVVVRPGEHEMDCFADRRPEFYGALVGSRAAAKVP